MLDVRTASVRHLVFSDRVSGQGIAIGHVRPSVSLFPLALLNQLNFDLDFLYVGGPLLSLASD